MADIVINPECRDGKHTSCSGQGWNLDTDAPASCPCVCHILKVDTQVEVLHTKASDNDIDMAEPFRRIFRGSEELWNRYNREVLPRLKKIYNQKED